MSRNETKTELVRRFRVTDESGNQRTVVEWGDFMRVQYPEGWSNWTRSGGRYKLGEQTVNPSEDKLSFINPIDGEVLTIVTPTRPQ